MVLGGVDRHHVSIADRACAGEMTLMPGTRWLLAGAALCVVFGAISSAASQGTVIERKRTIRATNRGSGWYMAQGRQASLLGKTLDHEFRPMRSVCERTIVPSLTCTSDKAQFLPVAGVFVSAAVDQTLVFEPSLSSGRHSMVVKSHAIGAMIEWECTDSIGEAVQERINACCQMTNDCGTYLVVSDARTGHSTFRRSRFPEFENTESEVLAAAAKKAARPSDGAWSRFAVQSIPRLSTRLILEVEDKALECPSAGAKVATVNYRIAGGSGLGRYLRVGAVRKGRILDVQTQCDGPDRCDTGTLTLKYECSRLASSEILDVYANGHFTKAVPTGVEHFTSWRIATKRIKLDIEAQQLAGTPEYPIVSGRSAADGLVCAWLPETWGRNVTLDWVEVTDNPSNASLSAVNVDRGAGVARLTIPASICQSEARSQYVGIRLTLIASCALAAPASCVPSNVQVLSRCTVSAACGNVQK
jgi:hypothetical protein